jgi:uncharacterized protein YuzE
MKVFQVYSGNLDRNYQQYFELKGRFSSFKKAMLFLEKVTNRNNDSNHGVEQFAKYDKDGNICLLEIETAQNIMSGYCMAKLEKVDIDKF